MIHREPFAGAPEAGHHFIGNQKNSVLVAESAQTLHVAIGRNQNAVRSGNRFDNDGRDRVRSFELNDLFSARQHFFGGFDLLVDAVIELGNPKNSGNARLGRPSAWITGQRQGARGPAVIGTITRANFMTSGEQTRDANRILIRFGAPISEEESINVAGR